MTKYQGSEKQDYLIRLLRKTRKDNGLTQVQLAAKLEKLQSYVSKYELGERRLDILELCDVCDACGVDVLDFIRDLKKKI
jgi:transcriptional regulator with XRE-family HTH domain